MHTTFVDMSESHRLGALQRLEILGTARETPYDRLVYVLAQAFRAPIAVVTFVDADSVWVKAQVGLGDAEALRTRAMCRETIRSDQPLIIEDLAEVDRFREHEDGEPGLRFYAGVALAAPDGSRVGTLSVLDHKRHLVTVAQCALLVALGADGCELLAMRAASLAARRP